MTPHKKLNKLLLLHCMLIVVVVVVGVVFVEIQQRKPQKKNKTCFIVFFGPGFNSQAFLAIEERPRTPPPQRGGNISLSGPWVLPNGGYPFGLLSIL